MRTVLRLNFDYSPTVSVECYGETPKDGTHDSLYAALAAGFNIPLDELRAFPGDQWEREINRIARERLQNHPTAFWHMLPSEDARAPLAWVHNTEVQEAA